MVGKARGRKSIFITGAASGMGRATAKLFVDKGWFVGIYDVNAGGLATLEQEIGSDNCVTGTLDVTQKPAFDASIAAFAQETDGKLDLLFSNAGIGESGWFEDVPYEASLRVVQVNLVGVITSVYAALPLLKATPNSLCFITSSSSATFGMPRIAVYSATKHGVKGLTEALSIEFARHGVRVADVLPGLIDTNILRATPNRSGDRAQPTEDEFYASAPKKGMFRLMPAVSVAEAVWSAYHADKLHWYVPDEIAWIDRIKGFAPNFTRNQIAKRISSVFSAQEKPSSS
jgi:NAD(P)-dependent dehydrogenase (short-subunit alcohol dehydrogenase family)